jgi:hypothetical protein
VRGTQSACRRRVAAAAASGDSLSSGGGASIGEAHVVEGAHVHVEPGGEPARGQAGAHEHDLRGERLAVLQVHVAVLDGVRGRALDRHATRQGAERAADAQAAGQPVPQAALPRRVQERDALRDLAPGQRHRLGARGPHGLVVARLAGHHEALVAEQPGAELALPAPPPFACLQRQRAQLRVAVGDAEDARQPSRLPGADALCLHHEHAHAAAVQLVRGREPRDARADDYGVPTLSHAS